MTEIVVKIGTWFLDAYINTISFIRNNCILEAQNMAEKNAIFLLNRSSVSFVFERIHRPFLMLLTFLSMVKK